MNDIIVYRIVSGRETIAHTLDIARAMNIADDVEHAGREVRIEIIVL